MRSAVVILTAAILGGCSVGTYDPSAALSSDAPTDNCAQLVSPALPQHTHAASGTSNAGMSCLGAGCHGPTSPGTTESAFAGTIYTDMTGATPIAGATVTVTAGTTVLTAVSDAAGNFYYQTMPTMTFPANTQSTTCPTAMSMADQITMTTPATTGGDCNGCHNVKSPAVPTSPATYVLYQ